MLHSLIKTYNSPLEGTGLVAKGFIPKGAIIWQLDAHEEKLTLEELNMLPPDKKKLAYQYKDKYIIVTDSSEHMNHSCDPNTWWIDDETLTARRDITEGEEITYDYATAEIDERFRSKWECMCGAKNCRKIISGKDSLNQDFQKTYQGHLPSWTVKFIESQKSRSY